MDFRYRIQTIINLALAQMDHSKFNPLIISKMALNTAKQINEVIASMNKKKKSYIEEQQKHNNTNEVNEESDFEMEESTQNPS